MSFLPHSLPPAPLSPRRAKEGSQQPYLVLCFKETRTRAAARCGTRKQLGEREIETENAFFLNLENSNGPNLDDARPFLRNLAKYGCWLPFPPRRGWKGAGGIGGEINR